MEDWLGFMFFKHLTNKTAIALIGGAQSKVRRPETSGQEQKTRD
ncbi:MAG: hypothetical protein PWQ17_1681 [Anaerophaga sp.]|nr:hypothetical protein [Anaerophaga sp.]MDN5291701.1 hypothetical protein [Anaerophaga sp.]